MPPRSNAGAGRVWARADEVAGAMAEVRSAVINSQSMGQLTRIAVVGVLLPLVACGGRTTLGTDSEAEPATRANLSEGCPIFRAPTSDCKRRRVWTLGDSLTYGTDGSIPPASYVGWRLGLDGWIQRNGF